MTTFHESTVANVNEGDVIRLHWGKPFRVKAIRPNDLRLQAVVIDSLDGDHWPVKTTDTVTIVRRSWD
ncbi:hypothetical protein [Desertimonas flava]|uniref:hypothetical protein n=1 Tax=Desertimonas flava TaxID=2064846 RepID=UPI000E34EACA|nr:hypothetical protein [Desertimonas flava]